MADCCQNTVTPRMIKAGQVEIGDKIQLEEDDEVIAVHGPAPTNTQWQMPNPGTQQIPPNGQWQAQAQGQRQEQANMAQGIYGIPGGVITSPNTDMSQSHVLAYEHMTPYMNNISTGGSNEKPTVVLPQSPLSPDGFQEEIDSSALQSFNGFLRTQIGRYMRVEQLVTSDRTEERLGFLVGVGSNFIILQDITTGNILVIDMFSIRLTYVYYTPAVVPQF